MGHCGSRLGYVFDARRTTGGARLLRADFPLVLRLNVCKLLYRFQLCRAHSIRIAARSLFRDTRPLHRPDDPRGVAS